jgi:epoxide hydrolase-like predicted phosphatase
MVALKAVIFDYGGVLRRDSRDEWDTVDAASGLPRGTLWRAWHDIPEYRIAREGAIDGATFRTAIHRAVLAVAGDAAKAEAAIAALEGRLAGLPVVDAGMEALVGRLRRGGKVKLGLLSNANKGFTEQLKARGVAALFDDVVASGDVGVAKPDQEVFRIAATRLGVTPEACLMIDDQAQHLRGAAATGMRTYLYTPDGVQSLMAQLEEDGAFG